MLGNPTVTPQNRLRPIDLGGGVVIDTPVILAPMSGVTDLPFRRIVRELGAGLVVSEMIASWAMVRENRNTLRMAEVDGKPSAIQLAGCDPEAMAEAARIAVDRGADLIDINFGCPVKKVAVGQSAGSALMRDEAAAARILEATVRAVPVPVTLKMRSGMGPFQPERRAVGKNADRRERRYSHGHRARPHSPCNSTTGVAAGIFISSVKAAVTIPVIANGDILTEDDAATALHRSGADGVMIGRGCCGRPWFPAQVAHFLHTGQRLPDPPLAQQKRIMLTHYAAILAHFGTDAGVKRFRPQAPILVFARSCLRLGRIPQCGHPDDRLCRGGAADRPLLRPADRARYHPDAPDFGKLLAEAA